MSELFLGLIYYGFVSLEVRSDLVRGDVKEVDGRGGVGSVN